MPVADLAHRCTLYLEQAVNCSHSLSANQKSFPGRVIRLEVSVGEAPEPAAGPEIRPPCESRRKRACSPSARNGRGRWRCVLRGRTAGLFFSTDPSTPQLYTLSLHDARSSV